MSDNTPDPRNDGREADMTEPDENQQTSAPDPKKRGLGRGLDALFGDDTPQDSGAARQDGGQGDETDPAGQRRVLDIAQMTPNPDQPRKDFRQESLRELADSIKQHGLLQPIMVRPQPQDDAGEEYEIIAGERRWRACQIAGIHSVPVIIHDLGDEQTLELALIENLQREDLNPIDEALGYQRLIDLYDKTQEELAADLGKSRGHIANMLRLVSLPDSVQAMVRDGKISAGHARTLTGAENPDMVARTIIDKGLSVREAEKLARESGATAPKRRRAGKLASESGRTASPAPSSEPAEHGGARPKDQDTLALEEEVSNTLGMKVDIQLFERKGRLSITFEDLDQLDQLLHRLTHGSRRHSDPF